MTWLLLASLLLQPNLDAPGALRLVAEGTGEAPVEWRIDGALLAVTVSGEAASIYLDAGRHDVWVTSDATGRWRALVRPEPDPRDGASFVPAWTEVHDPAPGRSPVPALLVPGLLVAAAVGLAAWPRHSKSPSSPEDSAPA